MNLGGRYRFTNLHRTRVLQGTGVGTPETATLVAIPKRGCTIAPMSLTEPDDTGRDNTPAPHDPDEAFLAELVPTESAVRRRVFAGLLRSLTSGVGS